MTDTKIKTREFVSIEPETYKKLKELKKSDGRPLHFLATLLIERGLKYQEPPSVTKAVHPIDNVPFFGIKTNDQ